MEWHIDDIIYRPEQIEVVLTVMENTSDCWTMWRPHDCPLALTTENNNESTHDENAKKYDIRSAQTTPNSALILKAGGVEHKVSPLTSGKRTILKMAFARQGAAMSAGMEDHASQQQRTSRKRKNGKSHNNRGRRLTQQK